MTTPTARRTDPDPRYLGRVLTLPLRVARWTGYTAPPGCTEDCSVLMGRS